ncbi:uncharacterized protein ABDE67_020985 isoform 2-T2 [Symphorus nematophorus]
MNFTVITAFFLCSLSWLSVSCSEFQTVEVQPGEDVSLSCTNVSENNFPAFWFRQVNRTKISCISNMYRSQGTVKYCDGVQNGKFKMSSNINTLFLNIKHVNLSDSGLYFCSFYSKGFPIFSAFHLNIKGSDEPHDDSKPDSKSKEESDGITKLTSVILGALTVLLVMVIIGLVVKNRKLQKADTEQNSEQRENVGSDDLNYAAVTFRPTGKRREVEPNVVYAATR